MTAPVLHLLAALLLTTGLGAPTSWAQEQSASQERSMSESLTENDWISYRDAYRAVLRFEKYGGAKHLILNHFQITPRNKNVSMDGLRLRLQGRSIQLDLPLDAGGRTSIPLLKSAYDDNAVLRLNRRADPFGFQTRVSIVVRPDGAYSVSELRAACEQVLQYQNHLLPLVWQGKRCVGVNMVYAKTHSAVVVQWRQGERIEALPPLARGPIYAHDIDTGYGVVAFRFGNTTAGQLLTPVAPLALVAVME